MNDLIEEDTTAVQENEISFSKSVKHLRRNLNTHCETLNTL